LAFTSSDRRSPFSKNTFTLPDLAKLVLLNRKAGMGRNPGTGATARIPAKKVVGFRVAKAELDVLLNSQHFLDFT
jgi:DNA-binding protein HU-beta